MRIRIEKEAVFLFFICLYGNNFAFVDKFITMLLCKCYLGNEKYLGIDRGNIMFYNLLAQHSTAQHSTAQHSTAQHSTAQHSTAQHSTINFGESLQVNVSFLAYN
ncbi:hypothetical protein [Lactococcus formosensis]|uniref:Uncharacterized protein n=1 Tax=Lactococcus formosensis TaxID=1281486 RepID=A0A9Q8Y3D9_9LACT|nr:hypothetical protein [Lactococcus formosensis]USJ21328.1 hypothetical protein LMK00_04820 [Lactococcus formosensis]